MDYMEDIEYMKDKIDKILNNQRVELEVTSIIIIIIIALVTNMWAQYLFNKFDLVKGLYIPRLLIITAISIGVIWYFISRRDKKLK